MGELGWSRYWWIWVAAVPVGCWAAARALGLGDGFPLIPLLAYTPYAAAAALIVTGIAAALSNWAATIVSALATLLLFGAVLPRALGDGDSIPPADRELRVLSANVHFGGADAAALLAMAKRLRVDLLAVEELTPRFARRLDEAGVEGLLPNRIRAYADLPWRSQASGSGLYSRLPLRRLPAPPPRPFQMPRAALDLGGSRGLRVVVVHTFPPKPGEVGSWRDGMESLPDAARHGPPWLLVGDFNATLDFPALDDLIDGGYRDAGDVTGHGLEPTWPQGELLPPPVTIDHALAEPPLAIGGYAVEDLPGSDHHAIFVRLGVPPASR